MQVAVFWLTYGSLKQIFLKAVVPNQVHYYAGKLN